MATLLRNFRLVIGALAVALVVAFAAPAGAQQPTSVNPSASAVKEQQLLQELQRIQGRITIQDQKEGVLIQPAGRDWRQFNQVYLYWFGAIAILAMLVVLVGYYLSHGMLRIQKGRSGRTIVRFNAFERFAHWLTATCFVVLAITGLNVTFGKTLLLPLLGPEAFASWSQAGKYVHAFLSFPFTIGVVIIFLVWIAGNIPNSVDVRWLKEGFGGLLDTSKHPPAYRFNAGQKGIYWIVVLGGVLMAITGYILMFPFYGTNVANMQLAEIIHGVVAVLFVATMLAHIYMGTIGMEGAFEAMAGGEVDVNWAQEHHSLWVEEEQGRSQTSRPSPQATPAE